MEYAINFTSQAKPVPQLERCLLNLFEADGHGLHAAQGEAAIIRRCRAANDLVGFAQTLEQLRIAYCHGAKQEITVAAHVLGERLHGDVDAMSKSVKVDSR